VKVSFIEEDEEELWAIVDLGIYSRTALMKVVHTYTDRCFVLLKETDERQVEVRFHAKTDKTDCTTLAGEFLNAVLDQTLREQIGLETEPVRNLILAHALSNTSLIHPELETADPALDPNEAAIPDGKKLQVVGEVA